jgi:tetratricopeptide (TPR) repeat protein
MNEGIKLYQSGKRFAALRILERSAQRDPTNHRATFYRGLVFNELGLANQDESSFRDAVKSFEASAKVNAGDPEVFFQLGIAYKSLEEYRDALSAFEQASEIQPHGQSHYHSGEIYLMLEEYNQAQESLRSAITAQPDYGVAYTALSKLYRRFKKRTEAVIVLKNAIENDPDEVGHYRDLNEVYTDLKQYAKALEWLEKAQQMSPYDAPITFLLGTAYLKVDDEQSAEVSLRKYLGMSHRAGERIMVLKARQVLKKLQKVRR